MHKKQQDRKKRKASIPSAISRYFRRNEGTTDYAQFAAPITLAGDFEIEFDGQTSTTHSNAFIGTDTTGDAGYVAVDSDGSCLIRHSNTWINLGSIPPDNSIHKIRVVRVGAAISLYIDDNLIGSTTFSGLWYVKTIWRAMASSATGLVYTEGTLANLKIWDNGVLVTDCPIDEPSGATIIDHASGNNATIINGLDADRGLFVEEPTLWKGQNLTVPPWDSVDQELLKA